MRWLLHGNMTSAVRDAILRHGDSATLAAEIELAPDAPAEDVFLAAQSRQLDLMTTDAVLAQYPFDHPVKFTRSLVFLQLEGADVEQDDAIDRLFERYKRMSPGRLYTVTASRVKIRQLPTLH
jgi:hypothetical protein